MPTENTNLESQELENTGIDTETSSGDENDGSEETQKDTSKKADDKAWLNERLKRAQTSAQKKMLESLGVKSVEDLKATLEEASKLKDEKLSEKERIEKQVQSLSDENAELKALLKSAQADNAERFIIDAAIKAGVNADDVDVALVKARKYIAKEFDADDDLDADSLKDFFADLRKNKPALFKADAEETVTTGDKSKAPPSPKPKDTQKQVDVTKMTAEERRKYAKEKYGL